jgi:signal transduction histidine kinase
MTVFDPRQTRWTWLALSTAVAAAAFMVLLVWNGLNQHRQTVAQDLAARLNQRLESVIDRLREQEDRRHPAEFERPQGNPADDLVAGYATITADGWHPPPTAGDAPGTPCETDSRRTAGEWVAAHLAWLREHGLDPTTGTMRREAWTVWPHRLRLGPDDQSLLLRQVVSGTGPPQIQVVVLSTVRLQELARRFAGELSPAVTAEWLRFADRPWAFRFGIPASVVEANTPVGDLRRLLLFGIALCLLAIAAGGILLRRARRQLLREQNFTAAVSHELKTPVAALQALADNLVEGRITSPSRQAEYHRLLSREATRLGQLVDNVLDQARLAHGRLRLRPQAGALNATCREVAQQFADLGIDLALDSLADVVAVDVDAIKRILINLVDNARKYAPGSPITIRTVSLGKDALLSVEDQGPGIPDDQKHQVLEAWQRAHGHEHQPGLGLGLALVVALVRAHGGSLTLRDNLPQGLVVEVRLPLLLERYLTG